MWPSCHSPIRYDTYTCDKRTSGFGFARRSRQSSHLSRWFSPVCLTSRVSAWPANRRFGFRHVLMQQETKFGRDSMFKLSICRLNLRIKAVQSHFSLQFYSIVSSLVLEFVMFLKRRRAKQKSVCVFFCIRCKQKHATYRDLSIVSFHNDIF